MFPKKGSGRLVLFLYDCGAKAQELVRSQAYG